MQDHVAILIKDELSSFFPFFEHSLSNILIGNIFSVYTVHIQYIRSFWIEVILSRGIDEI